MRNAVVEICLLDPHEAYQHAFVYIRQLAIHLRNALTLKKKDAHKHVYNWQFLHSLTLWIKLLSDSLGADVATAELEPLVYPTVQVGLGVISLIPTAKYAPLRCHCLRALMTLSDKAKVGLDVGPVSRPALHRAQKRVLSWLADIGIHRDFRDLVWRPTTSIIAW